MKLFVTAAAATLAFSLAGCGDKGQSGNASADATPKISAPVVPAPNGGDWTQVVSRTPDGGFMMGNPDAPVKLVEYGSFTCPHCADFSEHGAPKLIDTYVKTGRISYEYRSFVRDALDLSAALLSRCGGPTPFFKLTDQIFASQMDWIGKLQSLPPNEQQALNALPPEQAPGVLADKAGLIQFVHIRGVPADKARACLADPAETQKLVEMNKVATERFNLEGTPTFLINEHKVQDAATWEALEPKLRDAVG